MNKSLIRNILIISILAGLCVTVSRDSLEAGTEILPKIINRIVAAGKKEKGIIRVMNTGLKEDIHLYVISENLTDAYIRRDIKWLKVSPSELTVRPGEEAKVNWTARVPEDARGEMMANIYFSQEPQKPVTRDYDSDISLISRIFVTILDTEYAKGEITAFNPHRRHGVYGFAVSFKNTGNVHLRTSGIVILRDNERDIERKASMKPNLVPAGETLKTWALLKDTLEPGKYSAYTKLIYKEPVGLEYLAEFKCDVVINEDSTISLLDDEGNETAVEEAAPEEKEAEEKELERKVQMGEWFGGRKKTTIGVKFGEDAADNGEKKESAEKAPIMGNSIGEQKEGKKIGTFFGEKKKKITGDWFSQEKETPAEEEKNEKDEKSRMTDEEIKKYLGVNKEKVTDKKIEAPEKKPAQQSPSEDKDNKKPVEEPAPENQETEAPEKPAEDDPDKSPVPEQEKNAEPEKTKEESVPEKSEEQPAGKEDTLAK